MTKVAVYIDGFNLYNGLRSKHGRKYLWLDLEAVATRLLKSDQQLVAVRYFTASVRGDPAAQRRQHMLLGALRTTTNVDIVLGRFQEKQRVCRNCGSWWRTYEEKETDVAIAVALLEDGVNDRFDTAVIISADSDLCPAVKALKRLRPDKRIVAVFPPHRQSGDLRRAADASFTLGDAIIRQSLLPAVVKDAEGTIYERPASWV
jgi:uncharacterized LabA/DUF88 family protein